MKNIMILISVLFFSLPGFSQGIEFEHGTWKEVLAKAKQTNKPIFVDVYTSWCGPCKKMSKDIFPLAEVGKVYNANFICYQVDAEKGEGLEIGKTYEVRAYPTYLFIKADGTVFYRSLGSMNVKAFIEVSKTALAEMNDPKSITEWKKEYVQKKNDPLFLLGYMKKRNKQGLPNDSLFDEYLKLIPEEERSSDIVAKLYREEEQQMKVTSFAYQNLQKNRMNLYRKLFGYVDIYLQDAIMNTIGEATESKDEKLLATAILAYDQLPQNPSLKSKNELYMAYYQQTGETDLYVKYATGYCNDKLMKMSSDSIFQRDKMTLQIFENQVKLGVLAQIDTAQLAESRKFLEHGERDRISMTLNNIAWEMFQKVSDVNTLQDALRWSGRSLELTPNNPMWLDTYANLLYKLGQKEEAIAKEEEALRYADKKNSEGFQETLDKMKAGEKTWKE